MNDLRVFISSTFRDLQEEREHLVRKVFPEIRALCRERGITFTEVDLRWGLTEEDVVLGQVVRTCLEEIDACRPYFIGITGDRYGYVPDLVDIYKDAALMARYPWIEDAGIEGSSIIDMEFRHGALNDGNDRARFFFRRTRRGHELDVPEDERERIQNLKQRVRDAGFDAEEFRDPVSLGEAVYDALMEIIERDFASAAPPSELERERASHEAFAASRRHAYIPNPSYLTSLNAWHAQADAPPLILYAESGSGKSSLVSFWCQQLRRKNPDAFIIEHYVGIGAGATDHYGIMRHVMSEIKERFGRAEEIPTKPEELEPQFANWLGFGVGAPMLLVIDGINQLSGRALELHWLPPVMPPGVHLIISSTVEQTLVDLRRRGWRELAMQPLNEREREGVIVRYLSEYHKALSRHQVGLVAEDVKCSHPLFLRTLLEELRIDSSHEKLDERIRLYLGTSGTEDLFQRVLERMEDDFGTRSVRDVMSLIWCSRNGMSEEDLQALTGVSRLKLSTMLAGLDYHLTRRDGVLTFFHDYLRRAVEKRYLAEESVRMELWRRLAAHFEAQPVTFRATKELVHALDRLGQRERLLETIADVERFTLVYDGEARYEVLRFWAGVDLDRTVSSVLKGVQSWRGRVEPRPEIDVLGNISHLLRTLGCVAAALDLDRERLALTDLVDAPLLRCDVLCSIARQLRSLGDLPAARELAQGAVSMARTLAAPAELAGSLCDLGMVELSRGAFAESLECLTEAESIARDIRDRRLLSRALGPQGFARTELGDYEAALACLSEQEELARSIGDRKGVADAIGNRGMLHKRRGDADAALLCFAELETMARAMGDRRNLLIAIDNRGAVLCDQGAWDKAIACHVEAEAIGRAIGDQGLVSLALIRRANVNQARGELAEALACASEAEAIARATRSPRSLAVVLGVLSSVHRRLGQYEQALRCLAEDEELSRQESDPARMIVLHFSRGSVHLERGDYQQALETFEQLELLARRNGHQQHMTAAAFNIGSALLNLGEYERAATRFAEVARMASEAGLRVLRTYAHLCWAQAALALSDSSATPPHLRDPFGRDVIGDESCLEAARQSADEALSEARKLHLAAIVHQAEIALARIDAVLDADAARERLQRMLETADSEEQRADCHFWMWKLDCQSASDHRADAERLYLELLARTPKHDYKRALDELQSERVAEHPEPPSMAVDKP